MSWASVAAMPLFRNGLLEWGIAGLVAAAVLLALLLARRIVRRWHARMLQTAETELLEVPLEILGRTTVPFFVVVAVFLALQTLTIGPTTTKVLSTVITITLFWQCGIWVAAAVSAWIERKRRQLLRDNRAAASSIGLIAFIARMLTWTLVVLLTLDNLGVNISALIAGLGVGGVAVALAAQNILGDLFASLSITLDRPFEVGDFLVIDDHLGSVEYIGIKTTRLRSLGGEQIVMSNSDLTKSRMRNYGRMVERRVVFTFGVTYQTSADLVESIPALVRRIIEAQPATRFDRCHFVKYGESSLDFEGVYYVLSPDYNRYMDIQQAINLGIYREFERRNVGFAYPTQTLYLASAGAEAQRQVRRRAT
jgi:small-conductance mechanosensitive channel